MNDRSSPFLLKFFTTLLPNDMHHLIGDLEEEFRESHPKRGKLKSRFRLWYQILRIAPYFIIQIIIWNTIMLLNYLKVTWRNFQKHQTFTLINILGLAISMAVCLLIILFIVDQKQYDRFHERSEHIYRVISNFRSPSNKTSSLYATSPASMAETLERQYPEVEMGLPLDGSFSGEMRHDETTLPVDGIYATPDFFKMFSFELFQGDEEIALAQPGSIVLTPETARRLFGDASAVGQTLTALGDRDYTVTGIIDADVKTHLHFEALVSYSTLTSEERTQARLDDWMESIYNSYTYLLLSGNADPDVLESKIQTLIDTKFTDPEGNAVIRDFRLQSLTGINFGPPLSNEIGMVMPNIIGWFMGGFGIIVIALACFNYVSLTVARALTRTHEVGIRKAMGAYRSQVIQQFLAESVMITLLALLFANLILYWLLPEFNSLGLINFTENQIDPDLLANYRVYTVFILFSLLVAVLAGLYPALYLSSYNPAGILSGFTTTGEASSRKLRKTITVTQFSFSLLFILSTLILYKQFVHITNTDYGFATDHIVNIALQDIPYDRLRPELVQHSSVHTVAATSKIPAMGSINGMWIQSDTGDELLRGHSLWVDEHYISAMGLNLMAGRNFNPAYASDSTSSLVLSDKGVEKLGLGAPAEAIGKTVKLNREHRYTIIGVIENFISADPMRKGDPIILLYDPDYFNYAVVRLNPGSTEAFLSSLNSIWLEMNSLYALKYKQLDEQLRENPLLLIFVDFVKIVGLIAILSILISCLGLLGMAMYSAQNRVREIGIRKVLGASVKDIVLLLSGEYLVLVGIGVVIGTSLAWILNNLWLQQVSNKAAIGPGILIAGITGTALLALLTIGSQTIRAARANSVDNLNRD